MARTGCEKAFAEFKKFVDSTGLTDSEVAKRLGVTPPAICSYLHHDPDKRQVPKHFVRIAIEKFTGGRIRASDWTTQKERARLALVEPWAGTGTEG